MQQSGNCKGLVSDFLFEVDGEGRIHACQQVDPGLINSLPGELSGKKVTDVFPEPVSSLIANAISHAQQNRERQPVEYSLVTPEGIAFFELRFLSSYNQNSHERVVFLSRNITDRKRAEEKLRKSEERWRDLIEQASDGIFVTDAQGHYIDVNSTGCQMLGYTREEILRLSIPDILAPQELARLEPHFGRVKSGKTVLEEFVFRRKNGSTFAGEVSSRQLADGRLQAFLRDITERKQAEETLRFIQFAVDRSADAAYWMTIDGRFAYVNEQACRSLGYSKEELLSMSLPDIDPDFPIESMAKTWPELKRRGTLTLETRHKTRTGRTFPVEVRANFLEFGGKEYNCAFARDITERKQMEEDRRRGEALLRAICETTPDPIFVKDRESRVLLANPATLQAMDKTAEQVLGKTDAEIYEDSDVGRTVMENDRRVMESGVAEAVEEVIRVPGRARVYLSTKSPYRDADGRIIGVVGIARDITEQKRAEEEKLRFEIQAQQTHKLESIGVLAGGIAHDFNNMLTGVFGYLERAQSLAEKGLVGQITSTLAKAGLAIDRAKALTAQLLTFSKGGAPTKETKEIIPLLRKAAEFSLSGSNVALDVSLPGDLWPCDIDENQFAQVIDNILRNAKEAMPAGGTIFLRAENLTPDTRLPGCLTPGRYIRISVEDRGPGIPEENLHKVFDPFFTTKERGHGLGLSMVYSILKKHGGTIEVESEMGKGSTFHIYLPASEKHPSSSTTEQPKQQRGQGKILLMDDEDAILDLAGTVLRDMGYSVECAPSGEDAIRLFKSALEQAQPFDVVILDLTVRNGMGGEEAIRELLRIDPSVSALVSSGYANDPVMANPAAYGFKLAVAKPYRLGELGEALRSVLKERASSKKENYH